MSTPQDNLPPLSGRFEVWCTRLGINPLGMSPKATVALLLGLIAVVAQYMVFRSLLLTGVVLVVGYAVVVTRLLLRNAKRQRNTSFGGVPGAAASAGMVPTGDGSSAAAGLRVRLRPDTVTEPHGLDEAFRRAWRAFLRELEDSGSVASVELVVTTRPGPSVAVERSGGEVR